MGKNEKPTTDPDASHDDSGWKKRKDLGDGLLKIQLCLRAVPVVN